MVSFVILNYNTAHLVQDCIASIESNVVGTDYEVIVVDNNSCEADKDTLRHLHYKPKSSVHIIYSKWNGGFGLGNMLGANAAKGNYLCFINSDIVFVEDCVSPLVRFLQENDDIALAVPQQLNAEHRPTHTFFHKGGIRHELVGDSIMERLRPHSYPKRRAKHTKPFSVFQCIGSFLLFPADKFWAIGGFDTTIFLYIEEYDLGFRIKRHGWRCVVCPDYRVVHLGASSTRKVWGAARRERYISKLFAYSKHHGLLLSAIYRTIILLQLLAKPRKWSYIPAVIRGNCVSVSMRYAQKTHSA